MSIQQISFDKGAPRYGALLGGQVDALYEQPGDVRKFLDSGDFKPILTIFNERPGVFAKYQLIKKWAWILNHFCVSVAFVHKMHQRT